MPFLKKKWPTGRAVGGCPQLRRSGHGPLAPGLSAVKRQIFPIFPASVGGHSVACCGYSSFSAGSSPNDSARHAHQLCHQWGGVLVRLVHVFRRSGGSGSQGMRSRCTAGVFCFLRQPCWLPAPADRARLVFQSGTGVHGHGFGLAGLGLAAAAGVVERRPGWVGPDEFGGPVLWLSVWGLPQADYAMVLYGVLSLVCLAVLLEQALGFCAFGQNQSERMGFAGLAGGLGCGWVIHFAARPGRWL